MASMACYNCGDPSHIGRRCPEDQMYTRCPVCWNVCFEAEKHRRQCTNTTFRSVLRDEAKVDQGKTVIEISPILQMAFKKVSDVSVRTGDQYKKFGDLPFWLSDYSVQLKYVDGILNFDGAKGKSYTIAIDDSEGRRRLRIYISNTMVINGRYTISDKGVIKCDTSVDDNPFGYSQVVIKVNNNEPLFNLRAKWNGKYVYIDSYNGGAIVKDPLERHLQKRMESGECT